MSTIFNISLSVLYLFPCTLLKDKVNIRTRVWHNVIHFVVYDIVDLQIANSTSKTAKSEVHVHAYKMMIIPLIECHVN